jgi:hypothetical protein
MASLARFQWRLRVNPCGRCAAPPPIQPAAALRPRGLCRRISNPRGPWARYLSSSRSRRLKPSRGQLGGGLAITSTSCEKGQHSREHVRVGIQGMTSWMADAGWCHFAATNARWRSTWLAAQRQLDTVERMRGAGLRNAGHVRSEKDSAEGVGRCAGTFTQTLRANHLGPNCPNLAARFLLELVNCTRQR